MIGVPKNLIGKPGNKMVSLQWVQGEDTTVIGTNIYRSANPIFIESITKMNADIGVSNGATIFNNSKKLLVDGQNVYVLWRDFSGDIVLAVSSNGGDHFSPKVNISFMDGIPKPICYFPSMVFDKNKKVHIVWSAYYQDSYDIYYSNNIIGTFSTPKKISVGNNYSTLPIIGIDDLDRVYIVYQDIRTDTFSDIYITTLMDGNLIDPITLNSNIIPMRFKNPSLVIDALNVVHVVWVGDDGFNKKLYYCNGNIQVYGLGISGSSSSATVNHFSDPTILFESSVLYASNPCLNIDKDKKNIYLTWSEKVTNDNSDIKVSINNGNAGFATPIKIQKEVSISDFPFVALDDDGYAYVLWEDYYVDASSSRVFYSENSTGSFSGYRLLSSTSMNVRGITADFLNNKLVSVWTEYNSSLTPEFNVVFYNSAGITQSGVALSKLNVSPITTEEYVDREVENGIAYYYIAKNQNGSGALSDYSNQVLVKPYLSEIILPESPTNVVAVSNSDGIRLSWDRVDMSNINGFNVYKSVTGQEGSYIKIADTIDTFDFFDVNVIDTTKYAYVVTSLDKLTPPNESSFSNVAWVTYNHIQLSDVNIPFVLYGKILPMAGSSLNSVEITIQDKYNTQFTQPLTDKINGYYTVNAGNLNKQWSIGDYIDITAQDLSSFGNDSLRIFLQKSPQLVPDLQISLRALGNQVGISISEGNIVSTRNITLECIAVNAVEMIISENSNFAGSSWESYKKTKLYTLTPGDGSKTVYARYKDALGNLSKIVSDSTQLDTTAPIGVNFFIKEPPPVSNREVTLVFSGSAYQMKVSEDPNFKNVAWESFVKERKFTLSENLGNKIVYARFRDEVFNETGIFQQQTVYLVLPGQPRILEPIDGVMSEYPVFKCVTSGDKKFVITYSLELSRDNFKTISRVIEQSEDPVGWVNVNGDIAYSYNIGDTAQYNLNTDPLVIGKWCWRVRARNQYGYGKYSDIYEFHVGAHDGYYGMNYPIFTMLYADTGMSTVNYWYFFLMRQDAAYLYWSDGEIHLPQGVFQIMSNKGVPVDPTLYPADSSLPVTANYEWWMVVKWRKDITQFSISNESIRFCDKDKLPQLWTIDGDWVPVLFFPTGDYNKIPAKGSSLVSYSDNNYPLDNRLFIDDTVLSQHIANLDIHSGKQFSLPYTAINYTNPANPVLFEVNNITQDAIYSRGIIGKAPGIGMVGVSSVGEFADRSLNGVGMFLQGDYSDILLKNGTIYSRNGEIEIGSIDRPVSLSSNAQSIGKDGIVGENLSIIESMDLANLKLPIGISVRTTGDNAPAAVGRSNFIGVYAKGVTADLMLFNGSIKTKEGKGNLLINGKILNSYALLKGEYS